MTIEESQSPAKEEPVEVQLTNQQPAQTNTVEPTQQASAPAQQTELAGAEKEQIENEKPKEVVEAQEVQDAKEGAK